MPISTRRFDAGRVLGPVLISNAIEVDLVWNIVPTKVVKNVLHGQVAGGFAATTAVAQAVYAALTASAAWTAYKAYVNAGCSLGGVWLRDLRPPGSFPWVKSTGAASAGTGAGIALPPATSAVMNLPTASAGRNFRGRAYLPGLDSTAMNTTTGNFLAAYQTAANNFMAAVQTALTGQGITLCIINPARQQYTGLRGRTILARTATSIAITTPALERLTPNVQRRRAYIA